MIGRQVAEETGVGAPPGRPDQRREAQRREQQPGGILGQGLQQRRHAALVEHLGVQSRKRFGSAQVRVQMAVAARAAAKGDAADETLGHGQILAAVDRLELAGRPGRGGGARGRLDVQIIEVDDVHRRGRGRLQAVSPGLDAGQTDLAGVIGADAVQGPLERRIDSLPRQHAVDIVHVQSGEAVNLDVGAFEHQQRHLALAVGAEQLQLQLAGQSLEGALVHALGARIGQDEGVGGHLLELARPFPARFEEGVDDLGHQGLQVFALMAARRAQDADTQARHSRRNKIGCAHGH